VIPIREAYVTAVDGLGESVLAERRAVIVARLAECSRAMDNLITAQEKLETEISQLVDDSIKLERYIAGEKTLVIRSVQTELRRKLTEMESHEASLEVLRKTGSPQAFLRAVTRQARIFDAVREPVDLPLDVSVQGDLVVYGPPTFETAFVKAERMRLTEVERESAEQVEAEILKLNLWVRSILPEFTDIRTGFDDGVTLIRLLQVIAPGRRPSLPFPALPVEAFQRMQARGVAVLFAKELGAKGLYDQAVLAAGQDNPTGIIALLTSIQQDIAGVNKERKRVVSPRKAVRAQAREKAFPKTPPGVMSDEEIVGDVEIPT
jgi:hypothetical protein